MSVLHNGELRFARVAAGTDIVGASRHLLIRADIGSNGKGQATMSFPTGDVFVEPIFDGPLKQTGQSVEILQNCNGAGGALACKPMLLNFVCIVKQAAL